MSSTWCLQNRYLQNYTDLGTNQTSGYHLTDFFIQNLKAVIVLDCLATDLLKVKKCRFRVFTLYLTVYLSWWLKAPNVKSQSCVLQGYSPKRKKKGVFWWTFVLLSLKTIDLTLHTVYSQIMPYTVTVYNTVYGIQYTGTSNKVYWTAVTDQYPCD